MAETDRKLVERAAARLDQLLAKTTTGRWRVDGPWRHGQAEEDDQTRMLTAGDDHVSVVLGVPSLGTGRTSDDDLAYIAAMGPTVGRALVRWLQDTAREAGEAEPSSWAVAVAQAILEEGKVGPGAPDPQRR